MRRSWSIGLALAGGAVLIRMVLVAQNFDNAAQTWIEIALGAGLTLLMLWLTLVVYNRGESQLRADAGSDAWVHWCVDPENPRAWLSVVVSDDAVTMLGRKKHIRTRWPLQTITNVSVGPVRIGLLDHTGLTLGLQDGSSVSIALPSRSTFSYPREVADQAQAEILRRKAARRS